MPEPIEPIELAWWRTTADPHLNIRHTPGTTGPETKIGQLPKGSIVLADKRQMFSPYYWYHFTDAKDPSGNPIICTDGKPVTEHDDCWASGQYLAITDLPVDTPDGDYPVEQIIIMKSGKTYISTDIHEVQG